MSLLVKLGRVEEGEKLYRVLLSMNPDNYRCNLILLLFSWGNLLYFCASGQSYYKIAPCIIIWLSLHNIFASGEEFIIIPSFFDSDIMKGCKDVWVFTLRMVFILLMISIDWKPCTNHLLSNTTSPPLLRLTSHFAYFSHSLPSPAWRFYMVLNSN